MSKEVRSPGKFLMDAEATVYHPPKKKPVKVSKASTKGEKK